MEYLLHIGILIAIYSILAVTLNLLVGYTGMLSLAHAAFFSIGAYTVALLVSKTNLTFLPSLSIGIALSTTLGLVTSIILIRVRKDLYALATLGINTIVLSLLLGWNKLTNGALGISGIPSPTIFNYTFDSQLTFFLICLLFAGLVFLIAWFLAHGSFGRTLKAIRDNEELARALGYRTNYYRIIIFTVAAGLAAIAGGLFASYISFIEPAIFGTTETIFIMAVVILGGLASLPGSILGAAIMIALPELLRFIGFSQTTTGHLRVLIFAVILITLMLYRPKGLMGRYSI